MPVTVKDGLPALRLLADENIFVMGEEEAVKQDIRELRVLICNLMPHKIQTETQFIRLLSNSALQSKVELLYFDGHAPKNTPKEHMDSFYRSFEEVKDKHYDGLIITGAPLGNMPFEDVRYWPEFEALNSWARENVTSTLYLCWAAWAGLHLNHGVERVRLPRKYFGVFPHTAPDPQVPIVRGFDDVFMAPHSRENGLEQRDIDAAPNLLTAAESEAGGPYILVGEENRTVYVTGHSEYDPNCLKTEYERDLAGGLDIHVPQNYFPDDDPSRDPLVRWRSHANLLFGNWLNYHVYQRTPFDWISK